MRSAYRVTEKCRRSATMPMWRWHFYNRSSAVVACASVSRGRRANPVLTYETALRRFSIRVTYFYNRSSAVFPPRNIFLQPLFGGFWRCTARWRMPMDGGFLRCTAPLAHTKGEWFYQWGMSMVGRRFLCRIILVGIVLKLWLSVIFSMIYLSIKRFYEKMLEKLVFCC